MISVESSGHQPFVAETAAADDEVANLIVDLLPEKVIAGLVQDSSGEPVAGAEVRARPEDQANAEEGRRTRRRGGSSTRSEADGAFRIGSLGEVPHSLRVRARGFAQLDMAAVEPDSHVSDRSREIGRDLWLGGDR